jgi:phasin family protein
MQEDILQSYSNQAIKNYQSLIQLNSLWLGNLEKGIDIQLDAINLYTHINFEQAKNIVSIKGIEDLQSFSENTARITESFNERLIEHNEKISGISKDLISDSENIWQIL